MIYYIFKAQFIENIPAGEKNKFYNLNTAHMVLCAGTVKLIAPEPQIAIISAKICYKCSQMQIFISTNCIK